MALTFLRNAGIVTNVIPSIQKYSTPVPMSSFELTNLENPSKIGTWYNESKLGKTSLLSFLIGRGYETTAPGSTVMVEEVDATKKNRYDHPGLVTRSGNDFILNTSALAITSLSTAGYAATQAKPTDLKWVLPIKSEIIVFTEGGIQRHGTVTAISPDGKTLTALCGHVDGWAAATTNLTVVNLATRNNEKDCGDCYVEMNPSRAIVNHFNISSKCYSYNPKQLLANAPMLLGKTGKYYHDKNMNDAVQQLYMDVDASLLRSESPAVGSADYLADSTPKMSGFLQSLLQGTNGASVANDYITTINDFIQFNERLDQVNAPDEYMILCNSTQYNALQNLMTFNNMAQVQINPYKQLGDKMIEHLDWQNFKCIEIGGRKFSFMKWDALSQGAYSTPAAIASSPTFVMMPLGWRNIRTQSDGMKSSVPYVSVIWNGDGTTNMKLDRRSDEGATNCLENKVTWYSAYSLMVVGREHFIVGLPNAFNGYGFAV